MNITCPPIVRKSSGGELSSTQVATHRHSKQKPRKTTHTSRIPLPNGTGGGGKNNNFMKKFDKIHQKSFERCE